MNGSSLETFRSFSVQSRDRDFLNGPNYLINVRALPLIRIQIKARRLVTAFDQK